MKQLSNPKNNFSTFEKFIREISKGYYSDFTEYEPDHTRQEENNDHTIETEENDHTDNSFSIKENRKK